MQRPTPPASRQAATTAPVRRRRTPTGSALSTLLLLTPLSCAAQTDTPSRPPALTAIQPTGTPAPEPAARWRIGWQRLADRHDSRELLDDRFVFNRESGTLPGWWVQLERADDDGGHLAVQWRQSEGRLDYAGYTQAGLPLQTRTRLRRQQLRLDLPGVATAVPWRGLRLTLAAGPLLDALREVRAIQPTPRSLPLTETLDSLLLGAWGQLRLQAGPQLTLGLEARALRPLHQTLEVDSHGLLDTHVLRPSAAGAATLSWRLTWQADPHWAVELAHEREYRRIGTAPAVAVSRDGLPAGLSAYPGSRQASSVWQAGLTLSF